MDGVHDLGGLDGFGPFEHEASEPLFLDNLGLPWDAFRQRLMYEIAKDPQRPYYESWSAALESMVSIWI